MRVIGGEFRSRRLITPRGLATRPTSDRLRETLFNVLGPRLPGSRFLDLYAGSGAVGIEALSRGASFCCFVERAPAALAAIRANLATLRLREEIRIETGAAVRSLDALAAAGIGFDIVFLDPPYEDAGAYDSTMQALSRYAVVLLQPGSVIVSEHSRKVALPGSYAGLQRFRVLEQGDAALSFYRAGAADEADRS